MSLDDVVPIPWGGPDCDLRWIYRNMIEEYARHNGHANLIRERLTASLATEPETKEHVDPFAWPGKRMARSAHNMPP